MEFSVTCSNLSCISWARVPQEDLQWTWGMEPMNWFIINPCNGWPAGWLAEERKRWRETWAEPTSLLRSWVQVGREKQETKWLGAGELKVEMMYDFPIAAGTNYHKMDGFKQHKTILLQFWKAEIQSLVFLGFKVKMSTGRVHLEALKGNLFSCLFQLLKATRVFFELWSLHLSSKSITPMSASIVT